MEVIDIGDLVVKYGGRIIKVEVIVSNGYWRKSRMSSIAKIESLGKRIQREVRGEKLNLCMMKIQSDKDGLRYEIIVNSDEDEQVIKERLIRLAKLKRANFVAQILRYDACAETVKVVEGMIAQAKTMAMNKDVKKWG